MTTPAGFYWWHKRILDELRRLRDECGIPAYNVKGLAANVRDSLTDTTRYVDQLREWGMVVDGEAQWDYPGGRWISLP